MEQRHSYARRKLEWSHTYTGRKLGAVAQLYGRETWSSCIVIQERNLERSHSYTRKKIGVAAQFYRKENQSGRIVIREGNLEWLHCYTWKLGAVAQLFGKEFGGHIIILEGSWSGRIVIREGNLERSHSYTGRKLGAVVQFSYTRKKIGVAALLYRKANTTFHPGISTRLNQIGSGNFYAPPCTVFVLPNFQSGLPM